MSHVNIISINELQKIKKSGEKIKLVYVLPESNFKSGHIPGSINLFVDDIDTKAAKILDKNDKIIVYCENINCNASQRAAEKLMILGYKNVFDLQAGKDGWRDFGLKLYK